MNGKLKLLIPPALALLFMGGALMAAQFGAADGMAPEVSDASPAPSPVRPPPPARPPPQVRAPENAPAPQSPWKPSVAPAPQARPMNPLAAAAMGAQHPVPPPPGAEIRQPPPPPSNIQPMPAPEHPRGSAVPPPGYSDEERVADEAKAELRKQGQDLDANDFAGGGGGRPPRRSFRTGGPPAPAEM